MSPVLFILFMDEIIRKCQQECKKLHIGYRNLQHINITECAFADDVVIIAGKEEDHANELKYMESYTVRIPNGTKCRKNKDIGGS